MIMVGYGWRVLGLRVIPKHKLAPPLIRLFGQCEKQKAFMAVVADWGDDFFGEKEIPKHILAFLFLSSPIFITMTTAIVMTTIDRRELTPLSSYSEGILPQYWIYVFYYRPNDFYSLDTPLHSLHSCTVWFFLSLPSRHISPLAFLTLWHYEVCKSARSAWW